MTSIPQTAYDLPTDDGTAVGSPPYQAFSVSPPQPSEQREAAHLDAASGSGVGLMEVDSGTAKYLGRSAGALYVCEEGDEVSAPSRPDEFR